ncbi:DUF6415 family natural product biosynthesis protein [Streptomyces sp. NPDC058268]|uniref:DUF6415 family natural product biosynthesis protein n=1 Tax=Streptomyces sp. NPDC058268 TaxID=3346413 RepID=UPI0036EC0C53
MQQPTDATTTQALISEALAACRVLPPHERLVELNDRLRAELAQSVATVQAQMGGMDRGSVDWHRRQRALDAASNATAENLGSGLLSAAMHVAELGRRLVELNALTMGGEDA